MKIINNLNKPFFNPADDDSDDEKTFEVSEQNKKIKSNNQDITQNNEPLKNDFLNNLSKDFKDITFVEKNDSKRVLDNRLIVPLPKIEKSKRWRELADNRLSFFKNNKIQPEGIGASSAKYLITENMYQSIHNLPNFAKSHACILAPCDIAGLVSHSSIADGLGNNFLIKLIKMLLKKQW